MNGKDAGKVLEGKLKKTQNVKEDEKDYELKKRLWDDFFNGRVKDTSLSKKKKKDVRSKNERQFFGKQ